MTDEKEIVEETTTDATATEETTETSDKPEEPAVKVDKSIAEGTVTNVTHFGAFVKLQDGEEGLVHISEVANEYVTDIEQHVKVGDVVKVKILGRNDKNKLDLSMKQAVETAPSPDKAMFLHRKTKNTGFEDKISSFLKKSEEKQIDIRRNLKVKQGITKKRK